MAGEWQFWHYGNRLDLNQKIPTDQPRNYGGQECGLAAPDREALAFLFLVEQQAERLLTVIRNHKFPASVRPALVECQLYEMKMLHYPQPPAAYSS